jgi:hypothetical protein
MKIRSQLDSILSGGAGEALGRLLIEYQGLEAAVRTSLEVAYLPIDPLNVIAILAKGQTTARKIEIAKEVLITDLEPREAYDLGVEVIMQKPIKRDQFVDAVRRTLRSREEMWAEPSSLGGLQLHIALPRAAAAIEQGRIAFGRGGFCVRCTAPNNEGPVRFDLEFEGEKVSFAGHGLIRWADPEEGLLGVEISDLDEPCRAWAIDLITANAGSSHIPRAPPISSSKVQNCEIGQRSSPGNHL